MNFPKIALASIDTIVGDFQYNTSKILDFTEKAKKNNAEIVIFPELSLSGYPVEDLAFAPAFLQEAENALQDLSKQLVSKKLDGLYIVVGNIAKAPDAKIADQSGNLNNNAIAANSAFVLHNGEILTRYDKQSLAGNGVFDDPRTFVPGSEEAYFEVSGKRFYIFICGDIWDSDSLKTRIAAFSNRADGIITINASPYEFEKQQKRLELVAQIQENIDIPVFYCNMVGAQDELVFDGASFVKTGEDLQKAADFVEEILYFDYDSAIEKKQVKVKTKFSDINSQIWQACVLGLRDYTLNNGFSEIVLGISGGIDSAVAAVMAADAIGGENVTGILMPSQYSSQGSIIDAKKLAELNNLNSITQPINELHDLYQSQVMLNESADENIQARIRGNIVMAYSNTFGALAIATGNKSELAVGYSTIYGDAVGGYAPLRDVFKTRVFEIAKWRNAQASKKTHRLVIPKNSILKPPSAELKPGQLDEISLGDYATLDQILALYLEERLGVSQIVEIGYDKEFVETIVKKIKIAEWKRRQYPLGPKVSNLAFGRDRRIPITNKFTD